MADTIVADPHAHHDDPHAHHEIRLVRDLPGPAQFPAGGDVQFHRLAQQIRSQNGLPAEQAVEYEA